MPFAECVHAELTYIQHGLVSGTKSHKADICAAINVFRDRTPFNVLTDDEIDRVVSVLSAIPNPRAIAQIWRYFDRTQAAAHLTNDEFLQALEATIRRIVEE